MKKIILGLSIIGLIFLYGCREKSVSYSDSGSTVTIMVDQILKIELPGDASSSSDWRQITYDNVLLQKKGKSNYMLSSDSNSPGVYYFRFQAKIPGTSKIIMEYGHKYKSEKKATKIFEIDVVVIPKQ